MVDLRVFNDRIAEHVKYYKLCNISDGKIVINPEDFNIHDIKLEVKVDLRKRADGAEIAYKFYGGHTDEVILGGHDFSYMMVIWPACHIRTLRILSRCEIVFIKSGVCLENLDVSNRESVKIIFLGKAHIENFYYSAGIQTNLKNIIEDKEDVVIDNLYINESDINDIGLLRDCTIKNVIISTNRRIHAHDMVILKLKLMRLGYTGAVQIK